MRARPSTHTDSYIPSTANKINGLRLPSLRWCWALLASISLAADPRAKMPCHIITLGVEDMIRVALWCPGLPQVCHFVYPSTIPACLSIWGVTNMRESDDKLWEMKRNCVGRKKKKIKKSQMNHSPNLQCFVHSWKKNYSMEGSYSESNHIEAFLPGVGGVTSINDMWTEILAIWFLTKPAPLAFLCLLWLIK